VAVHKPRRLGPRGRIGVIAPAGSVDRDALDAGMEALRAEGFAIEAGPNVLAANGYLAGEAEARARDLVDFFRRPDIDAIFCARGGFGSAQLLPYLTVELSCYPKIFVGYSDVSFLLNWLRQACGMVTFHAPMVAMDMARGLGEATRRHLWPLLRGEMAEWKIDLGQAIRPGKAEAEIAGGCLSILVTTLGTPYEIDTEGKLLFLEDVGEKPYRVERMLTHLQMAGKLDRPAGVILGDFTNCEGNGSRGIREVLHDLFRDVPYPVVTGMRAGHGPENLTLPFGVRMRLDGDSTSLAMLEAPVA
jgi:muramoyltetrapeptide carboxypeptidase